MLGRRTLGAQDYVAMFRRRWVWLLVPAIVGAVAGLGITRLVAPEYLSQTLVLIEQQKVPDDYVKPVISTDLDARLASMKEEILSRSRLVPIIERYSLFAGRGQLMDDRIDTVRRKIQIKPIHSEMSHGGGLPGFFISFSGSDPHTAQLVCREITTLFVDENLRSRTASAEGTTDFLQDQLAAAKANLDQQDKLMADFQRRFTGELPADSGPNQTLLASLNVQLQSATQALSRLEQDHGYEEMLLLQMQGVARETDVSQGSGLGGAAASPEGKQVELDRLVAQAAELRRHYTVDHPDVVAAERSIVELRKELSTAEPRPAQSGKTVGAVPAKRDTAAVQQMRAQLRATELGIADKRREQAELDTNIRLYQARVAAGPGIEEQYKLLTRDNGTAQTFYEVLLTKMNQSKMASDLEKRQQGEQFAVLDPANLPESPSSPKRSVYVGGGLALGLGMGLLVAGFLEYRNTVLRNERDIMVLTAAPVLSRLSFIHPLAGPPVTKKVVAMEPPVGGGAWRIERKDA